MPRLLILLFLFFLFLRDHSLGAQPDQPQYYFDHFATEEGLYSRQVRDVVQSSDGFLWLGTNEGLTRYDGKEFTLVYDPNVPDQISTNRYVESMVIDHRDRIWMAINEQVAIYDIRKDSWSYLVDDEGSHKLFPLDFALDSSGIGMWIGCTYGLLHSIDGRSATKFSFANSQYNKRTCNGITPDEAGNLWIVNADGIFKLNLESGKIDQRSITDQTSENSGYTCCYLQGDSILWVGGWATGLIKHSIATNTSERYYYAPPVKEISVVYAIHPVPDKTGLWVGTLKGLQLFDPGRKQYTPITIQSGQVSLSEDTDIFAIGEDQQGSLLIGSSEGLIRYDRHRQDVMPVRMQSLSTCLSVDNVAHGISAEDRHETWFFTPYCENYIYDHASATLRTWPNTLRHALTGIGVFTLMMDAKARLWIATNELGLLIYDTHANRFTASSGQHFRQPPYWVNNIIEDREDKIWFCTQHGLYVWNEEMQTVDTIRAVSKLIDSGALTASVISMTKDMNGNVWLTTHYDDDKSGSLLCLREDGKTILLDRYANSALHGVHDFRELVCSAEGNVYVTTDRGLFAFRSGHPDSVFSFPEFAQVPGFSIDALVADQYNGIWIGSSFGVSRFDEVNKTMFGYASSNSLLGTEPFPGIVSVPALSSILVTQHGGFDIISTKPHGDASVPHIYCLQVAVNGVEQDTAQSGSSIFSYRQNDLAFHLAFPYFTNTANTVFRYKLNGYDDEWQTSSSGHIAYNNLPSGQYKFVVFGITGEGHQSDNQYTWSFHVAVPFYKAWWFQLCILMIIIGTMMVFYRHRELQRKRLQHIRDSFARDLHDEMGSNLSAIRLLSEYELLRNQGEHLQAMQTIRDKSNEVMDSMYDIIWSIHPEKGAQPDVAEKIRSYMAQLLEPCGVRIEFRDDEVFHRLLKLLSIERQRDLYLLLKEAIHNIAKHANAHRVVFAVDKHPGHYLISLQDDGQGFDQEAMQHRHGLGNMRSRAKSLGSQLVITSSADKGTHLEIMISDR